MPKAILPAAVLAAVVAAAPAARARVWPRGDGAAHATTLRLSASVDISAPADRALLDLDVAAAAPTAAQAVSLDAERMHAVIAALRHDGVPEKDLQTATLQVRPRHRDGGYEATGVVHLEARRLGRLRLLLAHAVAAGASRASAIHFSASNLGVVVAAARAAAVEKLRTEAELRASAGGYRVVRLASLAEVSAPGPVATARHDPTEAASEPGEVGGEVRVAGVFELTR